MKRVLIVTGAGVGTALLALLVAVTLGGPAFFVTSASIMLALLPLIVLGGAVLLLTLAAVTAWLFDSEREARQSLRFVLECYPLAGCLSATSLALLFGGDWPAVIAWGALGAMTAEYLMTRHARRWREARARAVKRLTERKRVSEERRTNAVKAATRRIATEWLTDAMGAPESKGRLALLAALDADAAWALARLARKGVPAEYVAERWQTGQPLDADALVASYRGGGVA